MTKESVPGPPSIADEVKLDEDGDVLISKLSSPGPSLIVEFSANILLKPAAPMNSTVSSPSPV